MVCSNRAVCDGVLEQSCVCSNKAVCAAVQHTGMERIETGKRVGAAAVHIPRFCGRTALCGLILSLTQMRQSSPGGWKERTPSQSADGFSRLRGRSRSLVAGRTHHLSPKLMFTAVKITLLLITIVTQIALKGKDHPDPSAYSSWRHFMRNSACRRSSKTNGTKDGAPLFCIATSP